MLLLAPGQRSLLARGAAAAAAAGLPRCLWELLAPQTHINSVTGNPVLENAGSPAAAAAAPAGQAADRQQHQHQQQQQQQQPPLAFTQLLQQLQRLHVSPLGTVLPRSLHPQQWQRGRVLHSATAAAVAPQPAAEQGAAGTPHHQQQQQQQQDPADLPELQPYQQAALEAVTSQLSTSQPRLLLQLPPTADVAPLITHLASRFAPSHSLLLLVGSSARAAALKASLTPLLNPGLNPKGIGPRVVPGDLVKPQHRVLIADLQQLQNMPSAAVQLLGLQQAPQALAVFEDGAFCSPQESLGQLRQTSSSQASAPTPQQQQGVTPAEAATAAAGAHSLAEQLLRQLRFIAKGQHTAADPPRQLVSISSRTWPQLLLPPQSHSSPVNSSSSSSSSSSCREGSQGDVKLPGFKLVYPEAVAAGLLKPVAAVRVGTGTGVPAELLAAADAAALAALHHSSSSSSSLADSMQQQQQQDPLEQLGGLLQADAARTRAIAAACKTLAGGGKVLVYACGQNHARELNLALHLQGIGSLALHEAQSPEDQAEVLAAFENNNDRVLVASTSCFGVLAARGLSCPVSCVVMGVPTLSPEVYAAAVAPGLVSGLSNQRSWGIDSANNSSSSCCLVVDFTDRLQAAGAAAAAAVAATAGLPPPAADSSSRRRRSRRTVQPQAAAVEAGAAAAAAAGGTHDETARLSYTCLDLLGSSGCSLLPLPGSFTAALSAAAAAAAARPRVDSSSSRSKPAQQPASQPAVMGDLVWTICADGSWAIPIKRGRGRSMAGLRVVWLTKGKRGFVPQVEQGLGNLEPLPGTKGKAMSLQKARLLAETWLKSAHPLEAGMRETGLEWRNKRMSDSQIIFCERHGLLYDPEWNRGTANSMIDKFMVEVLRRPIEPRTAYILRHLGPFAPAGLVSRNSVATSYQHTGALLQQALLEGLLTFSNSTAASAAAAADLVAAAAYGDSSSDSSAATRGKAGKNTKGVAAAAPTPKAAAAAGTGSSPGSGAAVMGSRKALQSEVEALWDAGLRPKFTWMVLHEGQQLLLDLMSGSYLWLTRVQQQQQQGDAAPEKGVSDSSSSSNGSSGDSSGSNSSNSSNSSSSAAGGISLDPAALYAVSLELPDGSRHPVTSTQAALHLMQQFEQQQQQGTLPATGLDSSSSSKGRGPLPVPLPAALDRAEAVATGLARSHEAFLLRAHVVRLCSMVGGWRVPAKTSEVHPCMPANHHQLEQLREAGLSVSRKFTGYDAHRAWLRHQKTLGLPEQLATPSQLARIRELALPLTDAAAATLTRAQAKGMLFKAQLALEAGGPSRREKMQGDRLKAKSAWRQSQQQQQPMQ